MNTNNKLQNAFEKNSQKWLFHCLLFLSTCAPLFTKAQITQQPQWVIPENRVSFISVNPTIQTLPTSNASFTDLYLNEWDGYQNNYSNHATTSDLRTYNAAYKSDGSILFFIVNGIIYRGDGTYISHMMYDASSSPIPGNQNNSHADFELRNMRGGSQICIVPFAGNNTNATSDPDRFYILAPGKHNLVTTNQSTQHTLLCCILEYTPSNGNFLLLNKGQAMGLGLVNSIDQIPLTRQIFRIGEVGSQSADCDNNTGLHTIPMHFAVSPIVSCSNPFRFLFVIQGEMIWRYKLTTNGFEYLGNYSLNTFSYPTFGTIRNEVFLKSEMEVFLKPDRTCKVAVPVRFNQAGTNSAYNSVVVLETDADGSFVSSKILYVSQYSSLNTRPIKGIEFSKNGRYLYTTHASLYPNENPLKIFDLTGSGTILNPMTISFPLPQDFGKISYSQLEMGADGRIYLAGRADASNPPSTNQYSNIGPADRLFAFSPSNSTIPNMQSSNNPNNLTLTTIGNISLQANNYYLNPSPIIGAPFERELYCLPTQIDGEIFYVSNTPAAPVLSSSSNNPCDASPYQVTLQNPIPGVTYNWYLNDNLVLTGPGPFSATASTSQHVISVVADIPGYCRNSSITINPNANCCGIPNQFAYLLQGTDADPLPISNNINYSPLSGNNVVVINGRVEIENNANVTFDGMELLMDEHAILVVNPGATLTINNSILKARCNKMWKGIFVQGSGKVIIKNNSYLQDAITGIESKEGGIIEASDWVTFNKNRVHLKISDLPSDDWQGFVRNGVLFTCSALTATSTSSASMLFPYNGSTNNFSDIAIQLSNVQSVIIGVGNDVGQGVTIEKVRTGVYGQNSGLVIENSEFRHLTFKPMSPPNNPGANREQVAIYLENTSGFIKPRTIRIGSTVPNNRNNFNTTTLNISGPSQSNWGTRECICLNGSFEGSILQNIFRGGTAQIAINCKNYLTATNSPNPYVGTLEIADNSFEKFSSNTMVFNDWLSNLYIHNNRINTQLNAQNILPQSPYLGSGIAISRTGSMSGIPNCSTRITNNEIYWVKNGIVLTKCNDNSITGNGIKINTANYQSSNSMGSCIRLQECRRNVVSENTVVGQNYYNWWVNGIWFENCLVNTISCNAIAHLGFGLRFSGLNYQGTYQDAGLSNKVLNNRFHNCLNGLALTDGASGDLFESYSTTDRYAGKNFWTGSSYNGTNSYHTFVYSHYGYTDWPENFRAIRNRLFTHQSSDPKYRPNPFFWLGKWWDGSADQEQNQNSIYNERYSYWQGYTLFTTDHAASVSCANPDLEDPYLMLPNFAAQLAQVQSQAIGASLPLEAADWWKKYGIYQTLLKDSLARQSGSNDSVFALLDASPMGRLLEVQQLLATLNINDENALLALMAQNNSLQSSNPLESLLKEVNQELIKYASPDSVPGSLSLEQLREFAMACPGIYGPGVFACRSLLSKYDTLDAHYISECEAMEPAGGQQRRGIVYAQARGDEPDFTPLEEETEEASDIISLQVFPNPSFDKVLVNQPNLLELEVYSIEGKCMYRNKNIRNTLTEISVQQWPAGLYHLRGIDTGGNRFNQKLQVVR